MLSDATEGTASTSTRPSTYYVAPLFAGESSGIQSCAYFDEQWQRVWPPTALNGNQATSARIEQADARDISALPPDIRNAIDGNAILVGVAVRKYDGPLSASFYPVAADGSITVSVPAAGILGAIFLFAAKDGTFGLRPTTDPQIKNSSM